ncbi:MAG TPA: ferric reductase-like transmembrane domain-containing protein [Solirubrobacteraceae bacterium]
MSLLLAATKGPSIYWYLTRATGAVALVLLTMSLALGVMDTRRFNTTRWPRFVIDGLHRNASLLALVFLAVHIVTTVLDSFVSIPLSAAIIPFNNGYKTFWLGLGTVAFDLMLAVLITSMLRQRIGYGTWRAVHWCSYACWPIALAHTLGTGSDASKAWLLVISIGCIATVLVAVLVRVLPARAARRLATR